MMRCTAIHHGADTVGACIGTLERIPSSAKPVSREPACSQHQRECDDCPLEARLKPSSIETEWQLKGRQENPITGNDDGQPSSLGTPIPAGLRIHTSVLPLAAGQTLMLRWDPALG